MCLDDVSWANLVTLLIALPLLISENIRLFGWVLFLLKNGIMDGSLHPFAGPIKNQEGEVVVKEGDVVSDEELLKMNWYVEGVDDELPE